MWQEDPGEWRGTVAHVQSRAQVGFTRLEQASQFIRQHTTQLEKRKAAIAAPRPLFHFNLGLSQRTTRILALALALVVLSVAGLLAAGQGDLGQLLGFGH